VLQKIWNFEGRTFDFQHHFCQRLYQRQRPCSTFNLPRCTRGVSAGEPASIPRYRDSSYSKGEASIGMDVKTANQIYFTSSATKTQFKSKATEISLPLSGVRSIIPPQGRKTPRTSTNDDTCYLCFNSPESHLKVSCRDNDFFSHTAEKARCSMSQGRATTRVHDTKCVV
jgi:hypothetical protein